MSNGYRCGFVTLAGRPSVGKSSLLNRLVGQKVSITSPHAQTTRRRIYGITTRDDAQIIYLDTPGLHATKHKKINRIMNRVARTSLEEMDCIIFVISATGWRAEDNYVLQFVAKQHSPVILCFNKIDKIKDKGALLPLIDKTSKKMTFNAIVPVSAKTGDNILQLEKAVLSCLPERQAYFPADQLTDCHERFMAAELVREQVFRSTREEVPYATAVAIERFKHETKILQISATIWVEKEGQKAILIGSKGAGMKLIGTRARKEMEKLFSTRVNLSLWVKVRKDWRDNERDIATLGYSNEE